MKKLLLTLAVFSIAFGASAQKTITIKGKVQFIDPKQPEFIVSVIQRDGFDKKIVAKAPVNKDNTYSLTMKVTTPGVYTLDCGKWQSVGFWAEDENLEVNFRGYDTAKMKIKNPPYVHIKGGKNNELMNFNNYNQYRDYQLVIGASQAAYKSSLGDAERQDLSVSLYNLIGNDTKARTNYLVEHYGDRNSVLALLPRVSDPVLVEKTLKKLEAKNPKYAPLVKYKKEVAEAKAQSERLALGKQAPDFAYPTPDGTKKLGPKDFRGKFLIVDFWASWCGPCRAEIPNMKEIYADYKDKGVEFLSVSIDGRDADWRKAMEAEGMDWPQVLATESGKSAMKDYQFGGIPYIILLDKEGNIIAKNLRGEKMRQAVEKAVAGKPQQEKSVSMGMSM